MAKRIKDLPLLRFLLLEVSARKHKLLPTDSPNPTQPNPTPPDRTTASRRSRSTPWRAHPA
jgi:hypothetical protein